MQRIKAFNKLLQNVNLNASRPPPTRVSGTETDYARQHTKEVDLTAEYLMNLFYEKQERKCYWLGVELNPAWIFESGHPLSLSVDRLGTDYLQGEVVISCRLANLGRRDYPEEDFKKVVTYLKSQWGWDGFLYDPPIQQELF